MTKKDNYFWPIVGLAAGVIFLLLSYNSYDSVNCASQDPQNFASCDYDYTTAWLLMLSSVVALSIGVATFARQRYNITWQNSAVALIGLVIAITSSVLVMYAQQTLYSQLSYIATIATGPGLITAIVGLAGTFSSNPQAKGLAIFNFVIGVLLIGWGYISV